MGLLIAPTLLNSYDWLMKCPASWKEKAYNSLRSTLAREPWEPSPEVDAGNRFEQYVYKYANSPTLDDMQASEKFIDFCRRVRGYRFQQKVQGTLRVDGNDFVCFSRLDAALFENNKIVDITDIKTTGNFKGDAQYLSGWQHKFYTLFSDATHFRYLINEWAKDSLTVIGAIHEVHYTLTDAQAVKDEIANAIRTFISYIDTDSDLTDLYYNVYNMYNKKG